MAAQANLSLNNWAAAAVTYNALYADTDKGAKWADKTQGTLGGYREVFLLMKRPADKFTGVTRVQVKITRPVIDGTTGALSYQSMSTQEFIIPAKATLAERQELLAAHKNFAAHATLQSAVLDFEVPW